MGQAGQSAQEVQPWLLSRNITPILILCRDTVITERCDVLYRDNWLHSPPLSNSYLLFLWLLFLNNGNFANSYTLLASVCLDGFVAARFAKNCRAKETAFCKTAELTTLKCFCILQVFAVLTVLLINFVHLSS